MNTDTHQAPQLPQDAVKCRFFAQYWGQLYEFKKGNERLILHDLKNITDEDAIHVAKIFGMTEDFEFTGKILCNTIFYNSESETTLYNSNAKAVDYLRSKGYALPFMEYSVKDLVSFGWVRLV